MRLRSHTITTSNRRLRDYIDWLLAFALFASIECWFIAAYGLLCLRFNHMIGVSELEHFLLLTHLNA